MNLIQILIVLFIVYVVYRLVVKLNKRELTMQVFILWLIFWLIVGFAVVIPDSLSYIASKVGVGRGVDVAVYIAVLTLFYIVFRIFIRLEKMEKNISEIVRKISISQVVNLKEKNDIAKKDGELDKNNNQ